MSPTSSMSASRSELREGAPRSKEPKQQQARQEGREGVGKQYIYEKNGKTGIASHPMQILMAYLRWRKTGGSGIESPLPSRVELPVMWLTSATIRRTKESRGACEDLNCRWPRALSAQWDPQRQACRLRPRQRDRRLPKWFSAIASVPRQSRPSQPHQREPVLRAQIQLVIGCASWRYLQWISFKVTTPRIHQIW